MIVFGPVPSRRLGRSLGVNNIPPKFCTYSCAYCQLGRTRRLLAERRAFYEPRDILTAVRLKVDFLRAAGEKVDYLSFVPDGEPTLDSRLGLSIEMLRTLEVPVAVISNASKIDGGQVRRELALADWVSLKLDVVSERTWRRLNRPHRCLRLPALKEGALAFAEEFKGRLVTETMLVAGVNDAPEQIAETADFLRGLRPSVAYLSAPIRPPAEPWVMAPGPVVLLEAYQLFAGQGLAVELLAGSEGDEFSGGGRAEADLLAITAVHPMRRSAVEALLQRGGADWSLIQGLLDRGRLTESRYEGETFYLRRFPQQ
jgi:wyosine [tRNA(Phe)-imidazoG37] synthetase (radical SAM superfamily)